MSTYALKWVRRFFWLTIFLGSAAIAMGVVLGPKSPVDSNSRNNFGPSAMGSQIESLKNLFGGSSAKAENSFSKKSSSQSDNTIMHGGKKWALVQGKYYIYQESGIYMINGEKVFHKNNGQEWYREKDKSSGVGSILGGGSDSLGDTLKEAMESLKNARASMKERNKMLDELGR